LLVEGTGCDSQDMPPRRIWVIDREACEERRAIIEVEGNSGDLMSPAREAADYAYKTRFGIVATAAANGDWEPARAWCAEIEKRFGSGAAIGLMRDIREAIEAEIKWRR
jgi:hypothetical protein